jgi:NADH-quinone oxidoreductase subunit J
MKPDFSILNLVLMLALVAAALWTVMTARLLRAALGLALTSAVLTIIMFRLHAELAAVFELSVCAGLIPAIFIAAIGLTRRLDTEALAERRREKLKRFALLPILVAAVGLALWLAPMPADLLPAIAPVAGPTKDVREVLWAFRHVDLIGQMLVLAAGAFGVVVLVKGARRDE